MPRSPPRSMHRSAAPRRSDLLELLVDQRRDALQLVLGEISGSERVAAVAVDPVENADVVLARIAEGGLALTTRLGAHVERDPAAGGRLVHELRHRAALPREQAAADERHARLVETG